MNKKSNKMLPLILLISLIIPFTNSYAIVAYGSETVEEVVPGGQSIGVKLHTSGVVVVGFSKVNDESPAELAGLEIGDIILQHDGKEIQDMQSFQRMLETINDHEVELLVKRKEQIFPLTIQPEEDTNQNFKLGLLIRDATAGIGTLTFYDPKSSRYGALGHMITDQQTQEPMDIFNGKVVPSDITSINKGKNGIPGEKRAKFSMEEEGIGTIHKNSDYGIFGKMQQSNFLDSDLHQPIEISKANEVKEGKAQIYTVIEDHEVQVFDIEIVTSMPSKKPETKGMIIKITDPKLLDKTGGIVQGMSGSPIIQNGKLAGAVTHVFVNDPTSGYGVHAEWMLNEAGLSINKVEKEAS
ncbi:SpoIVB peptidase [Halalkalibacillus halophilus]|uniref:SpoIVB peptidase n=1 Tax=Halalkalibacillus halophilus TaxID=392827 RepID=UPI00068594EB|nr:SpoIVB peptidase [Halalkalibacillus halophilus]